MGCSSFKGFTDEQKERMFANYKKAFNISGSQILNQKQYLIKRMIKVKQTIQVYPLLCANECVILCFHQASYIPDKFDLCFKCNSMGIKLFERQININLKLKCTLCGIFKRQTASVMPCKTCRSSGLVFEK